MRKASDKKTGYLKKLLSASLVALIVLTQAFLVMPAIKGSVHATGDLEVRVKYFGDQSSKIRTKRVFSEADLNRLAQQDPNGGEYYYSNLTSHGSVMTMHAYGPQVIDVITEAGIDINSVNRVNFLAGDGYDPSRDFTLESHFSGGRYYYPLLSSLFERGDNGSVIPLEGALDKAQEVPSILAVRFSSSKRDGEDAENLPLEANETYRFCVGQPMLQEGVPSKGKQDVTSLESVKLIHAIDVTLYGSPVDDIMMDLSDGQLKVGSKKKIGVSFTGDELFADDLASFAGKLKWKSSDPSVVKVDQKGNITVLKKGTATITVTASNGMQASVTINAVDDPKKSKNGAGQVQKKKDSDQKTQNKAADNKPGAARGNNANNKATTNKNSPSGTSAQATKAPVKRYITVREVNIGDQIVPEASAQDQMRQAMASDAQAMGKIRDFSKGAAAGTGGAALLVGGAGAFFRIRRFWHDTM